ncbi:hypothetical protein [Galenea microaerophila]
MKQPQIKVVEFFPHIKKKSTISRELITEQAGKENSCALKQILSIDLIS